MKIAFKSMKWISGLILVMAMMALMACASATPSTPLTPDTTAPPATQPPVPSTPSPVTTPPVNSPTLAPSSTVPPPSPMATPGPAPSTSATPTASGQAVTIDLVADHMAFDKSTISVPAGASVTINFNNKDGGIPHNVAVYQKAADGIKPVFIGDTINGPSTIVYHFTAPTSQGSYFFQCDIHPQIMVGTFVITP